MITEEARRYKDAGVFGKFYANGSNYPQWVHGRITEVDRNNIWVEDNEGTGHLFKTAKVVSFEPRAIRKITWKMPRKFIIRLNQ